MRPPLRFDHSYLCRKPASPCLYVGNLSELARRQTGSNEDFKIHLPCILKIKYPGQRRSGAEKRVTNMDREDKLSFNVNSATNLGVVDTWVSRERKTRLPL